ncbi:MAG: hypothetical protein AB1489_38330 [Acidobacteriota bacterium]
MRITVKANPAFRSKIWWQAARDAADAAPAQLRALLRASSASGVTLNVSSQEAEEIKEWCAQFDGWDQGPEESPHPLIFQPMKLF